MNLSFVEARDNQRLVTDVIMIAVQCTIKDWFA